MESSIRDIYKSNIARYKTVTEKDKDIYTAQVKNQINAYFYIIVEMFKKYGCINCGLQSCECDQMPDKHKIVTKTTCDGDPPWVK